MKVDKTLAASIALHVLVIGWGLVSFSARSLEAPPLESMPVDIISADQLSKLTAGSKKLWSTQDCPKAIGAQQVVVRPATEPATKIAVRWSGHRSAPGCEIGQAWVKPGSYHLVAASLGGEPADAALDVAVPKRPVITKTPKRTRTPSDEPTRKATGRTSD